MDKLLEAIRDVLVADNTLTTTVAAADIGVTHKRKTANYPCISFEVEEGDAFGLPTDVEDDVINVLIFSDISNLQAWQIHTLVKGLLHSQALSISNANVKIHSIQLEKKSSANFAERYGTQGVETAYKILYTEV